VTQLRALIFGLIALTMTACAPAQLDATYVGDSNTGAYTKAPAGWESKVIRQDVPFQVRGFWESGGSQAELLGASSMVSGVVVRRMPTSEAEMDLQMLARSLAFNLDEAVEAGAVTFVEGPIPTTIADLIGQRMVYDLTTPAGIVRVQQVGVIDTVNGKVYGIAVGCSTACYDARRSQINEIIESFEVTP